MAKCNACGAWFSAAMSHELCPTCERALRQLNGYAMPVVRCKECKHYMEYPLNKVDKRMCCYVHLLTPHFTPEDGFCSYGERREGE